MKKALALLGFSLLISNFSYANEIPATELSRLAIQVATSPIHNMNVINWAVGDQQDYDMSLGGFGKLGTMVKKVTKDEGAALWVNQTTDMMFQKDVADLLLNKADGKVLKYIHNGKEEPMPDDKIEIISQDVQDVTVPAGTFQAIHVVAKSQQVSKIEMWANPVETVMDGSLKMIAATQMGDMTLVLTKFKHGP